MLRRTVSSCILIASLSTNLLADGALTPVALDAPPVEESTGWAGLPAWQPPFLRDTQLGARPHGGPNCSPTQGYNHYDLPSKHYGLWYRPAAFAEDTNPHCKPRMFSPRGSGWANRLDCQQMDYHPYVVKQLPSSHGPSYYQRQPLQPCHCGLQGCFRKHGELVR